MIAGRIFLGLVFAYSGLTKLIEPVENFRGAITSYQVIPYVLVPLIAMVIPWMEFLFGAFMILGYLPRLSAFVLALMSLSFIALIVFTTILHGKVPEDCGCFGEGALFHLSPLQVVFLDILNLAIGIKLFLKTTHPWSLDSLLKSSSKFPQ